MMVIGGIILAIIAAVLCSIAGLMVAAYVPWSAVGWTIGILFMLAVVAGGLLRWRLSRTKAN